MQKVVKVEAYGTTKVWRSYVYLEDKSFFMGRGKSWMTSIFDALKKAKKAKKL